ncbi:hypothetical protein ACTXT7_009337 [Hymenolepis weldensis]
MRKVTAEYGPPAEGGHELMSVQFWDSSMVVEYILISIYAYSVCLQRVKMRHPIWVPVSVQLGMLTLPLPVSPTTLQHHIAGLVQHFGLNKAVPLPFIFISVTHLSAAFAFPPPTPLSYNCTSMHLIT